MTSQWALKHTLNTLCHMSLSCLAKELKKQQENKWDIPHTI